MNGSGCKTCPVKPCETMNYRGSACAAQRAKFGLGDPKTNEDHFREQISTEDGPAKFLMDAHDNGIYIPFCRDQKECWDQCPDVPDEKCMECMKIWLRKPYEGD